MKRDKQPVFDLNDFNRKGELKTPPLLVVTLLFLSRYPLILLLTAFSTLLLKRRGIDFDGIGLPPLDGLASSIPAIALLLAVLLREKLQRLAMLLRFGVPIGLVVATAQFLIGVRVLLSNGHDTSNMVVVEGLLALYCAVYFLRSRKASNYFHTYGAARAEADGQPSR